MDALGHRPHHAPVRVLPHIKKLDDCFGQFLVRVVCDCGACREIEPEALARLVGWKVTLKQLALRMRCSKCGKKAAEVVGLRGRGRAACRRTSTEEMREGGPHVSPGGSYTGMTERPRAREADLVLIQPRAPIPSTRSGSVPGSGSEFNVKPRACQAPS